MPEMTISGVLFLFSVLWLPGHFLSLPLCSNSSKPVEKLHLQQETEELNFSSPVCASLLKSDLSAMHEHVQISGKLFEKDSAEICKKLWETCKDKSILNSLLETPKLPDGVCLDKVAGGAYVSMVPHPDGSNRVFVSSQPGKVWLADVPEEEGSPNGTLGIVESEPFLDITSSVAFDPSYGLMSMAFHPSFAENGRFFMSFNCDKMKQPGCSGRCSCNTHVNCDPSKLFSDNDIQPCQYHNIIAEYTANATASKPALAKNANSAEVRRIFTAGLPYGGGGHAGQIIFGPEDGYMYVMVGDGSHRDDPYNFAQDKKSLLGKILRIDVDHIPSARDINEVGLWGNYSIPKDNAYADDEELEPEIWAMGFKNPWRCSFDSERPAYFICGDSGQDAYEEIDIVKKGGNYGWRVYEGPFKFSPDRSLGGNTSSSSINPIFPVMGYYHSELKTKDASASVAGGYFYRSKTDPCIYGRYLYMDLYAGALWAGTEKPENSRNFTTTRLPFRCAHDSALPCSFIKGNLQPDLGYVFSFAEDNKKDVYVLTSSGVYRVTRPSRCNFTCSKEHPETTPRPRSSSSVVKESLNKGRIMGTFALSLFLALFW